MAVAANMFFTLGRGFVVEASISLLRLLASVAFLGLPFRGQPWTAVDTASLATWILFGKLFGVATLVGFGEKRCRKYLLLCVTG